MVEFSHTGAVWIASLTEPETQEVTALIGAGGPLAPAAGPLAPMVLAAIGAGIGYITAMDKFGGNQGVDINGVVGTMGIVVTPRLSGFGAQLMQAARIAVTGRTVIDFVIAASSQVAPLGSALGTAAAGTVLKELLSGTPLGLAVALGVGLLIDKALPAPDPNEHGGVHADRTKVDLWERFVLAQLGNSNQVSLLAWQGLFSAQGGGGGDVYANRPQVGPWETWNMIDNHDGTVSFQSNNGHYLTALNGGGNGSYCKSDRTAIGAWERFFIVNQTNGHIALRTHDKGTFLSVQEGK